MELCITSESLKLLGTYFKRNLEGRVNNNITFEELQRELYDKALEDFSSDESKQRDRELIIQHLTILPQIVAQYLAENPSIANSKLANQATNLKNVIYNASQTKKIDDIQGVINDITNTLGLAKIVVSEPQQTRFSAVTFLFGRTSGQESLLDPKTGDYSTNLTDPQKVFEADVRTHILRSDNRQGYRLKMITVGEALAVSDINYTHQTDDITRPVMVLVNADGSLAKFDKRGNPSPTGKAPAYPIRTEAKEFAYQMKENAAVYVESGQMTADKAEAFVLAQVNQHLEMIKTSVEKMNNGETVIFDIDTGNSSLGFIEINHKVQTPLTAITNMKDITMVPNRAGGGNYPVLNIPYSNSSAKVLNQTLDTLDEATKETLFQLFTNPNLKIKGSPLTLEQRRNLIGSFIQMKFGERATMDVEFSMNNNRTGDGISSVVFGGKRIKTSDSNFREEFDKFMGTFHGFPYAGSEPHNYEVVEGLENVTHQNQIYRENGILMQARKPEISFGLYKGVSLDSTIDIPSIDAEGNVTITKKFRTQHIMEHGYTNVVPNGVGEIRGYGGYLGFTSYEAKTEVVDTGDRAFFSSVADINERTKASVTEERKVDEWWAKHPLREVVSVFLSNRVHEEGPHVLAQFLGDAITMFQGSDKTELYHESFHALTQGILTAEERESLYSAARSMKGSGTVVINGKSETFKFETATDLQIEEYLATEFRKYAMGRSTHKKTSIIGKAFEKILNWLKKTFGYHTPNEVRYLNSFGPEIAELFKDLYKGKVDISKWKTPTSKVALKSSFEVADNIGLNHTEMSVVMESMKALMSRFITTALNTTRTPEENTKIMDLLLQMSSLEVNHPDYNKIATDIYNRITEFENQSGPRHGLGVLRLTTDSNTMRAALMYMKGILQQRRDIYASKTDIISQENVAMLDIVLANFGDPKADIMSFQNDNSTIIGAYLNGHSYFSFEDLHEEDIAWNDENIEDNFRLVFDRTGAEQTVDEAANYLTRQLLSSVPAYHDQGQGSMKDNRLGLHQVVPFKTIIGKLVKIVGNRVDLNDIYNALEEASLRDKEVRYVLNLLGDLNSPDITWAEQKQWGAIWQSIAKASNPLRYFSMEKKDNKDNESVTYEAFTGRSQQNLRPINAEWRDNFKYNSEHNTEIFMEDEGDPKGKYLNAEDFATIVQDAYMMTGYVPMDANQGFFHEKAEKGGSVRYRRDVEYSRLKHWQANPFDILEMIGINLPRTSEIRDILLKGDASIGIDKEAMQWIVTSIMNRALAVRATDKKIYNLEDLFKEFRYYTTIAGKRETEVQPDISGYYKQLQILAQHLSDEHITFLGYNANNEAQSEKTKHSTLTVMVNSLNNAASYEELINMPGMEGFNYETNPVVAGSTWFRQMFNLDKKKPIFGKRNWDINIQTEVLSGSQIKYNGKDKGVTALASDELTKFITDFHLTIEGRQEVLRSEAKSTSQVVYAPVQVSHDKGVRKGVTLNHMDIAYIFSDDYLNSKNPDTLRLYEQFVGHIESELVRIARVKNIKARIAAGEKIQFDKKYLERGEDFFMTDLLLEQVPGLKNMLLAKGITESFTLDKILNFDQKKQIEKSLISYFKLRADELLKEKGESLTLGDNVYAKFRINDSDAKEDIKDNLMKMFVVNNFINNLNYATLFLGDPAIYNVEGEDFHKRIAGLISTGDLFRFDESWLNFVNSPKFTIHGFAEKHARENNLEYKQRPYEGYIHTGVIKESTHDSVYREHFAKMAGIDPDTYKKMKEADGEGWISFDMYRLLGLSSNEWSDAQEDLYQRMLKGEDIDHNTIRATFPIKKYQYYGDVSSTGESVGLQSKAFHKYSLAPIIPMLHKGTKLELLHNRMMEEGLDYVTMESGSKLGTVITIQGDLESAEADDIYNKDRNITDTPFTINKIHVRGLKSQIKVGEGFKGYITLPTQWRKMVFLGVMNGQNVPTDWKGTDAAWHKLSEAKKLEKSKNYQWVQKVNGILKDIEEFYTDQLLNDIGMQQVVKDGVIEYIGDSSRLVKYIQKQLKNEDMLPEEIAYITKPDGTMIDDLSFSLNGEKIEKILAVMVDKKLRRLKVNGEALAQMSGAMQEKAGFEKPTEADLVNYGANELAFYHLQDKDGNPVMQLGKDGVEEHVIAKMEVKIALQGKFLNLLNLEHPDGKPIRVIEGKGKDKKENRDASIERLNDAMRNKEWFKKHEKMFTTAGPRIPTQQENTLEAAVIKEFLPTYAGNLIILPSEIVVKAGSDFDYDKLFLMFPNLVTINRKVKVQEFKKIPETLDELFEEKSERDDVVKILETKLDKIYADRKSELDKLSGFKEEFKALNVDVYDRINQLKEERKEVIAKASEVYNDKTLTREEQQSYHAKSSAHKMDLDYDIDVLYTALDEALDEYLSSKESTPAKQIFDKFNPMIASAQADVDKAREERAEIEEKIFNKGVGGLENQLLDAFVERITMGNNFPNLVKANSTDMFTEVIAADKKRGEKRSLVQQAEDFVKKTYDKKNRAGQKSGSTIARSTIFDYRYNLQKHQENSVGMDSLGIAAIAATYYAMFSVMGATLNTTSEADKIAYRNALNAFTDPFTTDYDRKQARKTLAQFGNYRLKFNHNKVKGTLGNHIALGFLKNVDGATISEVLGQLINGYVDVAKDPWIFKIQGNKENTPQILFMAMSGMSVRDIVYFTSMPMVVEYNQIKAEMSGVFSNLSTEFDESPITSTSGIKLAARREMFKRYAENAAQEAGETFKSAQYKEVAEMLKDGVSADDMISIANSGSVFDGLKVLSHYFEIEDMSDHLTEFQAVTKFDTQKISSISDPEDRIQRTEKLKGRKTSIPNEWFDDWAELPPGIFNNDQLVIDLFSKYFGIRNHPQVVKASVSTPIPKGQIKTVVQNDFKNDFMWFLYQNSLYRDGLYGGYRLEPSENPMEPLVFNEESKIITYGEGYIDQRKKVVTEIIAGPNGFIHDLSEMFPTTGHFLRFEIEFDKLNRELEGMSDAEIMDKYYWANSYASGTGTVTGMKYKIAFFRSENNIAMFDYRMGMGSILKSILQKHPELKQQFKLLADFRYDYNADTRKSNMRLSEVKDSEIARIYIGEIARLKNHYLPEVREWFSHFDNMAIMQTGMNRRSKYDLAKIADQSIFHDVIENGIGEDAIKRDLHNAELAVHVADEQGSKYLPRFSQMFDDMINSENQYFLRVRGKNYIVDNIAEIEGTIIQNSMQYNNVKIVNNFNNVPSDVVILNAEDLYDENLDFKQDYIDEIKDQTMYIRDTKLRAPDGASQVELDEVLLSIFGIVNTGQRPHLVNLSKGQTSTNISIATVENLKARHAMKDEAMANESTIAIGQHTPATVGYKSSSKMYADEIQRKYPERLAGKSTKFKASDIVWVFGSGVFENAYKGLDNGKAELEQRIQSTFDTYHKPLIEKAIKAGVQRFNVGIASGIDELASKFLEEQGFKQIRRYTPTGVYNEYVSADSGITSDLYDIDAPTTDLKDINLHFVYNKELAKEINAMSEKELNSTKPYEMIAADIKNRVLQRFPDVQSKRHNFFEVMASFPGRLTYSSGLYASLVEEVLMSIRRDYVDRQEQKAITQNISNRQKRIDIRGLKVINVPFSQDNLIKIWNGEKTTTVRAQKGADQIGLAKGESAIINVGTSRFVITNRGELTIDEAGGTEAMAISEGLPTEPSASHTNPIKVNDKVYYAQYKQTARWMNPNDLGVQGLFVYDITPVVETQQQGNINQTDIDELDECNPTM